MKNVISSKVRSLNMKNSDITVTRGLGSNTHILSSIFSLIRSENQTFPQKTFLAIIQRRFHDKLISLLCLFINQCCHVFWCSCSIGKKKKKWKSSMDQPWNFAITFLFLRIREELSFYITFILPHMCSDLKNSFFKRPQYS